MDRVRASVQPLAQIAPEELYSGEDHGSCNGTYSHRFFFGLLIPCMGPISDHGEPDSESQDRRKEKNLHSLKGPKSHKTAKHSYLFKDTGSMRADDAKLT